MLSIWVVTGVLVYLAAQRLLLGDYNIEGRVMLITSACAVAVNIVYVQRAVTPWAGGGWLGKSLLPCLQDGGGSAPNRAWAQPRRGS